MNAHRFSPIAIAAAVALSLVGYGATCQAQTHRSASSSSGFSNNPLGAIVPADLHVPSAPYLVAGVSQYTNTSFMSDQSVAALAAEYNGAMASAGWQGTMTAQPEGSQTTGTFQKGGRSLKVSMNAFPHAGTSVTLEANDRLGQGDSFSMNGDFPADVHRPGASHMTGNEGQTTTILLRTKMSLEATEAEYESTMRAAGWQENPPSMLQNAFMRMFTKEGQRSVMLKILRSREGDTGIILLTTTARRSGEGAISGSIIPAPAGGQGAAVGMPATSGNPVGNDGGRMLIPRGFPSDVHLPASSFTLFKMEESTQKYIDTSAPVPVLFAEYENALKSAGWDETSESQTSSLARLVFRKANREITVGLTARSQETGINLRDHCQLETGSDPAECGDFPADVHLPSMAYRAKQQSQHTDLKFRVSGSVDALFAEYSAAMSASGWEKTGEQKNQGDSSLDFKKGAGTASVSISPAITGSGSVVGLAVDRLTDSQ